MKGRIFGGLGGGGVIEHNLCVLNLAVILSETFLVLRKIKLIKIINVRRSSSKVTCFFFLILIKLEFSRQAFEKYSKRKFNEHSSFGRPVVA